MKRLLLILLLAAVWLGGAAKKKPPFAMQVLETAAHRGEGTIKLDGRVRNCGEKPVHRLIILFDFLGPDGQVITTQRFDVDEPLLEPGQDAAFHAEVTDPVRAVRYRMNATDPDSRDFKITNPGPFVIE